MGSPSLVLNPVCGTCINPYLPHPRAYGPVVRHCSVCYNEENNIRQLAERLLMLFEKHSISGEVVLINDASTDGTQEIGDRLAAEHRSVRCIRHDVNRGIAGGWATGAEAANGQLLCFIDADLQHPPEEVWRLYREMQWSNADMIQGTRSSIGRMRDSRYFLSRTLNGILNLLFNMKAVDNKSGFVIAHREVLQDILGKLCTLSLLQYVHPRGCGSQGVLCQGSGNPVSGEESGKILHQEVSDEAHCTGDRGLHKSVS